MHHHPSTTTTTFSSSLLNHIFLSIDDHHHDPPADHHDRPISALRRSRLLHKWMVDKPNSPSFTPVVPPPPPRRRPSPSPPPPPVVLATADEDPDSFFSTTSVSSSDSSSGGLSSSETPSFDPSSKPKSSCFGPLRAPRPVKTKPPKPDDPSQDDSTNRSSASSRAARFYTQLKSLKQPISPGVKLAKYINSLTKKKTTKNSPDRKFRGIPVPDRRYKSEQASPEWCISAPKKLGSESSVPAAVIKAGSRPALMKRYEELRRLKTADVQQEGDHDDNDDDKADLNRKVLEEVALDLLNGYWTRRRNEENADRERHDDDDDDDDKDDSSCSSSDLFEIDHLSVIGSSELPVYETTTTTTTTARIN